MIVSGRAGTGKSHLKQMLKERMKVAAPTGVAAFNVERCTLHSLLTKGELKVLEGNRLQQLQTMFKEVYYLIMTPVFIKLFHVQRSRC